MSLSLKFEPKFHKDYRLHFFTQMSQWLIFLENFCSTVSYCVWPLGTKILVAENAKNDMLLSIVLIMKLKTFQ